jgi:Tfp pilus assembly protein PilF
VRNGRDERGFPRTPVLCLVFLLAAAPAAAQEGARRARAARMQAIGQAYLAAGDPGSASGYFRDAIRIDPDYPDAYVALGRVYLARGSMADALEAFQAGLRRQPDHPPLWRGVADALEAQGSLEEAAVALRELLRRVPDDVGGHRARADLARRRGAWTEALASYRAVVDLSARGFDVDADALAEARRYAAGLEILAGSLDPVTGHGCPDDASAVRRALADCD